MAHLVTGVAAAAGDDAAHHPRHALLGWWMAGLAPAVALLLGAVLAPTDPVLASDVQVGEPLTDDIDDPEDGTDLQSEDDDIRFALTAEAGLNDGLAFPFVHLALLLLAGGFGFVDAGAWVGWYVVGKIALGVAVGLGAGWLLGRQAFHARSDSLRLADTGEPLLALAALLASYGAAELVGGYGFLAVFACAMRLRASDPRPLLPARDARRGRAPRAADDAAGPARPRHGDDARTARRPRLARRGRRAGARAGRAPAGRLCSPCRCVGAGSTARAVWTTASGWRCRSSASAASGRCSTSAMPPATRTLPGEAWLWSTVAFTVVVSVLLHGGTATAAMSRLDERRTGARLEAEARMRRPCGSP